MRKELFLKEIQKWHIGEIKQEDLSIVSPLPPRKAHLLTGNDAAHLTGSYEPCLVIDTVILTRKFLLEVLYDMSDLEGPHARRR